MTDEEAVMPEEESPAFSITGSPLTPEETAALSVVIAQFFAEPDTSDDAGACGPHNRRHQRRLQLNRDHSGLWGRPGPASWKQSLRRIS